MDVSSEYMRVEDMGNLYQPKTLNEASVAFDAINLAWVKGINFTYAGFCRVTGRKDNRHLRNVMNTLVREGMLYEYDLKFEDGRTRKLFCAQTTKKLPLFVAPEEKLALPILS